MDDHEAEVAGIIIADAIDKENAAKADCKLLREKVEKLEARHEELTGELYGHGYEISGFHQNGNLIALDVFFEDNGWLETIE